jgi:hypothetical protein
MARKASGMVRNTRKENKETWKRYKGRVRNGPVFPALVTCDTCY